jgi:hypothetical protein
MGLSASQKNSASSQQVLIKLNADPQGTQSCDVTFTSSDKIRADNLHEILQAIILWRIQLLLRGGSVNSDRFWATAR